MPFSLAEFAGVASPKEQKDFSLDAFAGVTPEQKQGDGFSLDAFADVPKSKIDSAIDWIGEKTLGVKNAIDYWTSPVPEKEIQEEWKNQPIKADDTTLEAAGKGVATYFKAGVPLHSVLGLARGAVEFPVEALTAQMTGDINKQAEIVKGLFDFVGRPTGVKDLVRGWVEEGKLLPEKFSEFEDAWTKDPFGSVMAVMPFVKGGFKTVIDTAKGVKKGYVGTEVISDAVQKEGQGEKITSTTLSKEEPKVIQEKDYINDVTLGELQDIVAKGGDATAHVYEGLKEGKITQQQAIEVRTKAIVGALEKAKNEAEKNRIWENAKVEADNMQDVIENFKPPTDILLKQAEAKKGKVKETPKEPWQMTKGEFSEIVEPKNTELDLLRRYVEETGEKINTEADFQKVVERFSNEYKKIKQTEEAKKMMYESIPENIKENFGINQLDVTTHKNFIGEAWRKGKSVPPEVLKDYPDLQKPIDYEPFVKGGATGELPKYAEGSAINLEKMDTTNDIKQFINQLTKDNEQKIGKKTVSWKETEDAAKALGWNIKDVIKQRKGKAFTAAELEAMRQINVNAVTELHNKIKNIPADQSQITPEMQLDIVNSVSNYGELLKTLSSASSEAGRALNIHKKMIANNPEFAMQSNINRITKTLLEQGNLEKISKQLIEDLRKVDFNDPAAVNKVIQKYHKASIGDMIYEGWMNALLSSPKTHFVNITSNALTLISKSVLETPTAALLESFRKNKQVHWGEVPAEAVGAWQGLKEGVRAMVKSFKTGMPSDMWSKAELPHLNALPGKTGEILRIPTKALTAADEFFKSVLYRMELNRQAYSSATKEGLKGNARVEKMADILAKPTPEMLEKAHNEALYRTFNKPLGTAGNTLMKFRDSIPYNLGRYIVPFLRTPANIAKFALERTPLNFVKIAKDYKQGKITPEQLSFELAKPIVGSLLGAATVMLAKEGLITGGGTKDKNKRDTLYRTGWKPYSIKIGDEYYGYNRLEPLGSVLGLAADFGEMKFSKEDQKLENIAGQISLSFGKNIASKTFMKGVSGMFDAISDPERYGDSFVNQFSGTLIPSIVASVANTTDPVLRQKGNPLETIKSRIPVVSEKLLPKRDLWGNPIEKAESPINRLLSPIPVSTIKADKIDKEMLRLGLNIGMPQKKIMGIELSPEEYDSFVTIAGQTAKKKLDLIVNSPSWENKPEESKARLIKGIIEAERKVSSIKILRTKDKEEVKAKIKENRRLVKPD